MKHDPNIWKLRSSPERTIGGPGHVTTPSGGFAGSTGQVVCGSTGIKWLTLTWSSWLPPASVPCPLKCRQRGPAQFWAAFSSGL